MIIFEDPLAEKVLFGRDVWLSGHSPSNINWEGSPSDLEASVALSEPEDSSLCTATPKKPIPCEQEGHFELGPDDSSDFFELNSHGDMIVPLHVSCLRMIEQVEQYRRLQDRCTPMSPSSVELVYKALCQQKRCKAYLYDPPYTRVYMADGDHDFHGVSSDPRKDISWISIGKESVRYPFSTVCDHVFLADSCIL